MKNEMNIDKSELPVSGAIRVQRERGYGSIPDLDDEAPAEAGELQRMVAFALYGPILALPGRGGHIPQLILTESGDVDWEAVGPAGRGRPRPNGGPSREGLARLVSAQLSRTEAVLLAYARDGVLRPEHILDRRLREAARAIARPNPGSFGDGSNREREREVKVEAAMS